MSKIVKTPFCRAGKKNIMAPTILKMIPPHNIYVEPFVGSGAILFQKEQSLVEIISDLDKDIIRGFNLIKTYTVNKRKELIDLLINECNTFGSTMRGKLYKNSDQTKKIDKITEYKQRMKSVKIFNKDYKAIIKQFDTEETFFFFDPPYENSGKLYKHNTFDYIEFAEILKNIAGKWLLTINDSPNIRKLFKDFKIKKISDGNHGGTSIGKNVRNELIITNY
jgi:DNA adenine methylase